MKHKLNFYRSKTFHRFGKQYITGITMCLILVINIGFSQNKTFEVKITDTSNSLSELVISESYFLDNYKSAIFYNTKANKIDNCFTFKGEIQYPTAIRIYPKSDKIRFNELFFLDTGNQSITLELVENRLKIKEGPINKSHQEYLRFLSKLHITSIDDKINEDSLLLYVKKYPKSYVALYSLILQTFDYDYKSKFKQIATYFAPNILLTKAFKYYKSEFLVKRKIGSMFLTNRIGNIVAFDPKPKGKKYTLLIFSFAGCKGCIEEKNILVGKYESSDTRNLEIVGINVDAKRNMQKAIAENERLHIPWKVYWDADAKIFNTYTNISRYPSNLLVNDEGAIISKDISTKSILNLFNNK